MNRRDFLRFVGTGVVVGPAAVKAILATVPTPPINPILTGELGAWEGIKWYAKEFDFGHSLGVALSVTHPRSQETYRNAVRLALDDESRTWFHECIVDDVGEGLYGFESMISPPPIRAAKELLAVWGEEQAYLMGLLQPPKGWRPARRLGAGVAGDEVLEGRETFLPGRRLRA